MKKSKRKSNLNIYFIFIIFKFYTKMSSLSGLFKEVLQEAKKKKKPSAGLSKKDKSSVVKKAKAGKDIGKKGKGFKKVAKKAAKKYGSEEKGKKVAAAAMWKNLAKKKKMKESSNLMDLYSVSEKKLSSAETKEKEKVVKSMKKNKGEFQKNYGKKAKDVMYATATKIAKEKK